MAPTMTLTDEAARGRIHNELHATLFVEAGAGTGKTRELIERLVRLVAGGRAELRSIAAITFTEAAAAELRDRVRLRLEDAARDESELSETDRQRCRDALTQLDAAAIETLHAFAQRILSDHVLEAGLPPAIDVQEEIRASIAFDERWAAYVDELLSDAAMEETLLRAFSLGLEPKHLRDVALAFHENWDRVEPATFPDTPLPPVESAFVLAQLREACAWREHGDPSDKLYEHLGWVETYCRRLAACENDLDRLRVLGEAKRLGTGGGRQDNWDGVAPGEIRGLLADAQQRRDLIVSGARASVLSALLRALRDFTLTYADERRRSGRLEFHDLLVQARDLLRRDAEVRCQVHERYTHLLIDEFQDTDPLQIEIATLIAGEEAAGDPPPWYEMPVTPERLFFVGDPKQSVYRFRRADIELYQRAQARFSDGLVRLTRNFRALPSLIDWTNHVFARDMGTDEREGQATYVALEHKRPQPAGGPSIRVLGGPSQDNVDVVREREARELARVIISIGAQPWQVEDPDDTQLRGARYQDIALLLPTRTALPPIEQALESAGVPYRVESRSLVYATQEVRDLLSILRAIDDPTDEVALIAALRSPAFGCGDDDLLRYRQAGGRWDYRAEPPGDGPVASAMAALRSFHERRWWMPISGLVEAVIRERRMFELAFAHRRPRERWQRLRFVLDQARAFAEAGGRTLRQFIDWAERQAAEGSRVIETVVPEPDDDAVRIMTVHAAKGLEFPIVILAGLNVQANYKAGCVLWSADGAIEASLGAEKATFETTGYETLSQREKELEQYEKVRLLYVAATRARDHLIVSLHHKLDVDCHAARLYPICMDARDLWRPAHVEAIALQPQLVESAVFDDSAEKREGWLYERAQRIEALSHVPAVAATEIARRWAGDEADPNLEKEGQPAEAPPWKRGRAGTAFGRAVHAVLQSIDLAGGGDVGSAARAQAAAEGIPSRANDIARAAEKALDAPALREAIAGGRYWRELYVAAPIDGVTLEGFIDLLYETPEGLVVVDYKTDAVPDAARLDEAVARYRVQGAAYALALQEALGRPVARCVFVFTKPSGAQERAIEDLGGAIAEVRERLREPVG